MKLKLVKVNIVVNSIIFKAYQTILIGYFLSMFLNILGFINIDYSIYFESIIKDLFIIIGVVLVLANIVIYKTIGTVLIDSNTIYLMTNQGKESICLETPNKLILIKVQREIWHIMFNNIDFNVKLNKKEKVEFLKIIEQNGIPFRYENNLRNLQIWIKKKIKIN
ncbi:hypothetical protein [Marinigracilibium pacificum]|uniref:Uncharacterized protein n=1 Tax=Marinigracilibium pacificum TaxID=2729599 RepID=A0A848J3U9_9BACT|nr:hypothetical protein [Marinigracilibium pacificum]NMM47852.1 hypothetical protein [Marinigracilibium pacificum]